MTDAVEIFRPYARQLWRSVARHVTPNNDADGERFVECLSRRLDVRARYYALEHRCIPPDLSPESEAEQMCMVLDALGFDRGPDGMTPATLRAWLESRPA